MVRTVRALHAIDLGFDPSHVVALDLPGSDGPFSLAAERSVETEVLERVSVLDGVAASGVGLGPLGGGMSLGGVRLPGDSRQFGTIAVDAVSAGYFEALGARREAGRFFERADTTRADVVVVVNQSAARLFWGTANPIGRTIIMNTGIDSHVIGVVHDIRGMTLDTDAPPTISTPRAVQKFCGRHDCDPNCRRP
jgi:hypothetical protein